MKFFVFPFIFTTEVVADDRHDASMWRTEIPACRVTSDRLFVQATTEAPVGSNQFFSHREKSCLTQGSSKPCQAYLCSSLHAPVSQYVLTAHRRSLVLQASIPYSVNHVTTLLSYFLEGRRFICSFWEDKTLPADLEIPVQAFTSGSLLILSWQKNQANNSKFPKTHIWLRSFKQALNFAGTRQMSHRSSVDASTVIILKTLRTDDISHL